MAQVDFSQIQEVAKAAVLEICEAAHLQPDSLFVVGCSSSEV
ncbi:MAG: TIGR01440 family protein, partial [Lachnospiraceae bacterium]|nr:TIGR01440 family protein [Lachnospiraceae bacterium]